MMRHLLAMLLLVAACQTAAAETQLGTFRSQTLALAPPVALSWMPPLDTETYGPEPPPPPCPKGMVHIGRYCIDRYEAHLVVPSGDGYVRHPHYERPPEGVAWEARSEKGVFPQAYISRKESAKACERAGKRLCTWLEWRRGCQGPTWRRYPYAGGKRRGACNQGKKHLLHELFGEEGDVRTWEYDKHFNSPRLNQEPGFLAKTGAYEECVSKDGLFDMNGNLHEWVSTMVTESFVERMEEEDVERRDQPWTVGNGMFLGGFYSTDAQHGPGCFYNTIAHEPRYHDYSTGFRCCKDALRKKR
jgi:formylglycine-generating enzyme required for sulfatase activity